MVTMLAIWGMAFAGVFCLARAAVDFREKRYVLCALGLISGGIILLTPIPTHAVKIDLPTASNR
ncbi:hypothetical protein M529_18145 [Sphingobium ummariense RL-3]|uniref:Uncharacterized protein n=1 Tax=Sphingobium ummariense RL-3 TaxID=1346791 RepID=T0K2A8_9SPHN|nr:hypothetical protein M529_18145 [Sphingobium ummariense RL-3]